MKKAILMLCLLWTAAYADEPEAKRPPAKREDAVTNENITTFKNIDDVLTALGLEGCSGDNLKDFWKIDMLGQGIEPCKKHLFSKLPPGFMPFAVKLKASESGILNDKKQEGNRVMVQYMLPDCEGKNYWVRYTYDRVETKDGDLCGFELFIKKPSGRVIGTALNKKGEILKTVPDILAFDKDGNKTDGKPKEITSGKGCFECHPHVSADYGMTDQANFWEIQDPLIPHKPPYSLKELEKVHGPQNRN